MNILVLGHAGSGKSTLVKEFGDFLQENYSVKRVNLDTATPPAYECDINARDFVKAEEIMKEYSLGINGALLKSMDILLENIDELILKDEFVLYDTPGQLELFLYTDFGERFTRELRDFTCGIFLIDSKLCKTIEGYLSAIAQSAVISLRTGLETVTVFNKSDIFYPPEIENIQEELVKREGVLSELIANLIPFYNFTTLRFRRVKISATRKENFDELYSIINEIFCSCGDLS